MWTNLVKSWKSQQVKKNNMAHILCLSFIHHTLLNVNFITFEGREKGISVSTEKRWNNNNNKKKSSQWTEAQEANKALTDEN